MIRSICIISALFLNFSFILLDSVFSLPLVQVANLEDVNGSYTPGANIGDKVFVSNFCVLDAIDGYYSIRFTSLNNNGTTFRAKNTRNQYLRYYLNFFPNYAATGMSYSVDSGITIPDKMRNGNKLNILCTNNNSNIKITFLQSDLDSVQADVYSDVLTILVVPN